MSKAAAIPTRFSDHGPLLEYTLQTALARSGLVLEHRAGGYVILAGAQVLLDRDRDGGALSLDAAIGFVRRARLFLR